MSIPICDCRSKSESFLPLRAFACRDSCKLSRLCWALPLPTGGSGNRPGRQWKQKIGYQWGGGGGVFLLLQTAQHGVAINNLTGCTCISSNLIMENITEQGEGTRSGGRVQVRPSIASLSTHMTHTLMVNQHSLPTCSYSQSTAHTRIFLMNEMATHLFVHSLFLSVCVCVCWYSTTSVAVSLWQDMCV